MADPTVIVVTNGTLLLADDEAGLVTGVGYECQVSSAAINATPNLQQVPATFCAPASQIPAATGFELALTWLQDWTSPGGGLSGYAYTNDTLTKFFSLTLNDQTEPIATGSVRVVAGAYGGDAGVPLTSQTVWPLVNKPTITMPAPLPLAGAEQAPADADTLQDA
jgi:hypothetical protein